MTIQEETNMSNNICGLLAATLLNFSSFSLAQTYKCVEDPVQDDRNKVTVFVKERAVDLVAMIYHKDLITGRSWFETYVENCTENDPRYLLRCTKVTQNPDGTKFYREFHIFDEWGLPGVYDGAAHHELHCTRTFTMDEMNQ